MDYEKQTSRNVSVSVENEEDYFSCKMKPRTSQGLWNVETLPGGSGIRTSKLYTVTITVEDVDEPPEFVPPVKKIIITENTEIETLLVNLTAIDPDGNSFQ